MVDASTEGEDGDAESWGGMYGAGDGGGGGGGGGVVSSFPKFCHRICFDVDFNLQGHFFFFFALGVLLCS